MTQVRYRIFNLAITATGRFLVSRNRLHDLFGSAKSLKGCDAVASRHTIQSGQHTLDAVLVKPGANAPQASVLICHGIGETVEQWRGVQQMLAVGGVASLVFDYSGYGCSAGSFNPSQSEQDAVAAFRCLEGLTAPLPVSVLGFSLGSGIVTAIVSRVPARRLVLCAAFTSLRKAAVSIGIPKPITLLAPPIWDAEEALRGCPVPVLVVHGDKDRLFPVRMATELVGFCSPQTKLVVVPGIAHNQPFRRPSLAYWGPVISWLIDGGKLRPPSPHIQA